MQKTEGHKHFFLRRTQNAGFSLLEILMAISILILITAAASVSFTNSRNIRDLTTAGQNVVSTLRLAQSKTLAGENGSQWGVQIEADRVILFQGSSYTAGASGEEIVLLPPTIEIANISLAGGGTGVVFKRIEGTTDYSGTFDLRVKENTSLVFPVTIESSGKAYRSGQALTETGTRVTDTRHKAFTLGWSISTAATTTLIFENPPYANTSTEIEMEPYFDAGHTVFDWSGTISVGTTSQTLRIHTSSISAGDTVLHVDRDCRNNTKRMTLEIDSKQIAIYEANCKTATVGPYGGTVTEP